MRAFILFILALLVFLFFFFNDTATTEIYTLSLHDALPIFAGLVRTRVAEPCAVVDDLDREPVVVQLVEEDRKSTRLNSSHGYISYAVFCLKKKKKRSNRTRIVTA